MQTYFLRHLLCHAYISRQRNHREYSKFQLALLEPTPIFKVKLIVRNGFYVNSRAATVLLPILRFRHFVTFLASWWIQRLSVRTACREWKAATSNPCCVESKYREWLRIVPVYRRQLLGRFRSLMRLSIASEFGIELIWYSYESMTAFDERLEPSDSSYNLITNCGACEAR